MFRSMELGFQEIHPCLISNFPEQLKQKPVSVVEKRNKIAVYDYSSW